LNEIYENLENDNKIEFSRDEFLNEKNLINILFKLKIRKSKSDIRKDIEMGGVYLKGIRLDIIQANDLNILLKEFFVGNHLIIRVGKKKFYCIKVNKN
jgi:tyrosyl-tRNA synthetase